VPRAAALSLATLAVALVLSSARPVFAQQTPCPCPQEPPGLWVGSVGFGFALNRGNTDTTNLNLTFDGTYDPKQRAVWKFQGLYLRGQIDGEPTVDRLLLKGRYERNLNARAFLFGELQYLRDEFKEIDYLLAPSGGVGYKLVATDRVSFAVDAGAGVKWEKNPGLDTKTSAVITSGDRLEWKVSPTATITHAFGALWDADDFGDALYTFNVGLATSIARRLELKVELLDAFKSKPPNDLVKRNDVALLTAIVFKF
jgi:putative salt-induced outer membrane protein YdiY